MGLAHFCWRKGYYDATKYWGTEFYEIVKQAVSDVIDDRPDKLRNEIRQAARYDEFARENQQFAEEGLSDYIEALKKEDDS